jgi:hypothetical protein
MFKDPREYPDRLRTDTGDVLREFPYIVAQLVQTNPNEVTSIRQVVEIVPAFFVGKELCSVEVIYGVSL